MVHSVCQVEVELKKEGFPLFCLRGSAIFEVSSTYHENENHERGNFAQSSIFMLEDYKFKIESKFMDHTLRSNYAMDKLQNKIFTCDTR